MATIARFLYSVSLEILSLTHALLIISAFVVSMHVIPYLLDPLSLRRYPGPFLARFTDTWMAWAVYSGRWSDTVDKLHRKYGPYVRLSPTHISVMDPAAMPLIYGHSTKMLKAPFYDAFVFGSLTSIFNTRSRAEHARKRRVESHMFAPQNIRAVEPTSSVHVRKLVEQWDTLYSFVEKTTRGSPVQGNMGSEPWMVKDGAVWINCMNWLNYWSFDNMSDLALGEPFGMLTAAEDKALVPKSLQAGFATLSRSGDNAQPDGLDFDTEEIHAIKAISTRADATACLGWLPAYWRPVMSLLSVFRRSSKSSPKLIGMVVTAIAARLARPVERQDMLQRLLEGRDEEGNPMGPEELSNETATLIIAGADTTAITLCAIIYYVARSPHIQTKLQAELDAALSMLDDDHPVAPYGVVEHLPYLDAVINEGLRLHSTVGAGLPRIVTEGGIAILGREFKEGTCLSVPLYSMHRSKRSWGEDAAVFRPERWIENQGQSKQKNDAFAPFSTGPRACIGRNLATMSLHIVLATLIRRYTFVLQDPDALLEMRDLFVRKPTKCIIGLKRRL